MNSEQKLPSAEPWRGLPPRIGELIRPVVPELSDEVIAAIREAVPAYRRPLEGRFGAGIRLGVEEALTQFADLVLDPELDRSAAEGVYRGLGRGEFRERRSLDSLLAAYRLGARVSWRRIAALAIEAEADRRTLALLAEAVFAYIDGLSALSAEGYAAEQSAAAGELQRRRRRLALALLEPAQDPEVVSAAAAEADWRAPETIAGLAWSEGARGVRTRLPEDALVLDDAGGGLALLGDPLGPGRLDRLARMAAAPIALGPEVRLLDAARSAERARAVLALLARGVIEADGLVRADDHLGELITHGDQQALADLARRRLAPLEAETPASRRRLVATLRAWLDHQGEVGAVASELHVHPQTVRYRLGRLRERLGDALDEPGSRFDLALALRAEDAGEPAGDSAGVVGNRLGR